MVIKNRKGNDFQTCMILTSTLILHDKIRSDFS